MSRRFLLGSLAAEAAFGPAFAVGWPSRPVRMLSPYGAGGSNDISLRILAEQFEQRMSQKFLVENKPGASTTIANQMVARAEPDGYTLLYAATPYATAEAILGHLNYDPRKDLRPVALAMLVPLFLIVNAKSPWKTLQEFVDDAKSKTDGVTFASPAAGSAPHLAAELLMRTAGFKGLVVQFKGDATSYTELLAERVDATSTAIPTALPHIKAGTLRVLGCFSEARSAAYPDALTLREQGQDVVAAAWFGFMAPAATPDPIVDKMQTEIDHALSDDGVKQKLSVQGLDPHYLPGAAFGRFIESETEKWSKIIRKVGLNKG